MLFRSLTQEMRVRVTLEGFSGVAIDAAFQLCDSDLKAVNSRVQPERVKPTALTDVHVESAHLYATLPPASWNVVRLKVLR